jgi:flagellar basal body-associated protein FliL
MEKRLMFVPIVYVVVVVAFGLIAMLIFPGGQNKNHHRSHAKSIAYQYDRSGSKPSTG